MVIYGRLKVAIGIFCLGKTSPQVRYKLVLFRYIHGWLKVAFGIFFLGKLAVGIF